MQKIRYFLCLLLLLTAPCHAKTLSFSNITWQVRDGFGNPGPNFWSSDNVWVDANGWLHLKMTYKNNRWNCPSLYTDTRFGFGSYWFFIKTYLDKLDPNVVLALFNYPTSDIGKDETNEIDIELSKWGSVDPNSFNLSYTVWPSIKKSYRTQLLSYVKQENEEITHGFIWDYNKVFFLTSNGTDANYENLLFSWNFAPPDYAVRIPEHPMPIYIGLYLLKGVLPDEQKTTEVVIKKFCYLSVDGKINNCALKF